MLDFLLKNPVLSRWYINSYAPYIGAAIRAKKFDLNQGKTVVEMPLTCLNKNVLGTQFGGSLYSMVDPFFVLMLMRKLGPAYIIWDKAASIDFISPGKGTVYAEMEISDQEAEDIIKLAALGEPVYRTYHVEIKDREDDKIIAKIEKLLYIRKKIPK